MASRRLACARSCLMVAFAMAAGASLISVPTAASAASPWIVGKQTVPYFNRALAVAETVDVRTGSDRDRNGTPDTIRVEITRPDTAAGDKVPVIIHASPYFFNGTRDAWETDFFVPRGYAVATVALPGTDFSTGCADVGGEREVRGTKAVIDWLNGRTEGYHLDGSKADATEWSTGKAGMIGVSWDGTIANSVASTGVSGLETIVPVAAISSWYDYTRGNGIPFYEGHVGFLNDFVSNYDSAFCRDMTPRLQKTATVDTENSWITMPLSGSIASLGAARQLAPILTTTVGPAGPTRDVHEFIREFFEGSK